MSNTVRPIEIQTEEGPVLGLAEDGLSIFRGVPFASAPVGPLRFKPPVPPGQRADTLDARGPANIFPQPPLRLFHALGDPGGVQDESSLTLSIWAPHAKSRKLPVLVWIHGGALMSGSGALSWYDGARLARESDIVVVSINYRLGALGFLKLPGLVEGNMGLLDQVRALEWIFRNIPSFGGDPDQITLMGQSAGGVASSYLLAMPQTRNLIHRAIFLSGGGNVEFQDPASASAIAERFCSKLGIDARGADALEQLQSAPVEAILEAQVAAIRDTPRTPGDVMPAFSITAVAGITDWGRVSRVTRGEVDVIVGTTSEEMRIFEELDPRVASITFEELPKAVDNLLGVTGAEFLDQARRARPDGSAARLLNDAYTLWFSKLVRSTAVDVSEAGGKAWLFRFDWHAPESRLGACHCIELPFVFGNFDAFHDARMLAGADQASMEALSRSIRSAIGRFVANGSPNGDDLPEWPCFSQERPVLMAFDRLISLGWLGTAARGQAA